MPVSSSAFFVDLAIMADGQVAQDGVGEQASTGEPSAVELTTAIKHVLHGKSLADLEQMNLKALRRSVCDRLGVSTRHRKSLAEPRRIEFGQLAEEVVSAMMVELTGASDSRPDWHTAIEDEEAFTGIFLITFAGILLDSSATAATPLKVLDGLTREHIRDAVMDAINNPSNLGRGGRPPTERVKVRRLAVFMEMPLHFHVAVQLSKRSRWLPFKNALRCRSGLASHWSTSHTEFWSALRYGYFATDHKRVVDTSPLGWTDSGEQIDFYEESQEPWLANVWRKRRENAEAGRATGQSDKKKQKKAATRFTKLDFYALVQDLNLTTPSAVKAHAQKKGNKAMQASWRGPSVFFLCYFFLGRAVRRHPASPAPPIAFAVVCPHGHRTKPYGSGSW